MKNYVLTFSILTIISLVFPFASAESVPDWVKNTAGWWATDTISETEFVNAIEFLINVGIIQVSSSQSNPATQTVPDWVKNTAGWWATDTISETEFVNAIEFLINVGIISVESDKECVNDLLKYFGDKQKILDVCNEHESSIHEELIPYDIELKFNSKGLRGEEFSEKKASNVYRIFMVGGSTMLSAETTNDTTIPSILQKMFDSEKLDTEIEVINAGIGGAHSYSEYELIKSKIVNYDPDLIIMYDGWNDLSIDAPVDYIMNNYDMICGIAVENNFELIITIQPIGGFGNKMLTEQEKINSLTGNDHNGYQLIQAKSTYNYLIKEMKILDDIVEQNYGSVCSVQNLYQIYDDVNGPIYWDQGHVLHAGNLIAAEKFFELSMKKIDPSFISDYKFTKTLSNYNSIPIIKFLLSQIEIDDSTFDSKLKDITNIDAEKGKYFALKEEFGEISESYVDKDLRNIDLNTIDFNGEDITGANLSGTPQNKKDLRNIDFTNTIIRDVDFSYTNLEGKDFSGIDIRGADFSHANLKDADFTDAIFSKDIQIFSLMPYQICSDDENRFLHDFLNFSCVDKIVKNELIRTNFENANLTNAKFGSTDLAYYQQVNFVNFKNADLTNINSAMVIFTGCNFDNAKLNNMTGRETGITSSDFNNTEMNNIEFQHSWFQHNSFNNVQMTNGNFNSVTMIDTHFPGTDLEDTNFINVYNQENSFACKNNDICENPE